METAAIGNTLDLWEAWIDLQNSNGDFTLYVIGDVCVGKSKTAPVLAKKIVQGAPASHLILEVLPFFDNRLGHLAEVGYAETIADINQYKEISICAGEDIIARIATIEIVS